MHCPTFALACQALKPSFEHGALDDPCDAIPFPLLMVAGYIGASHTVCKRCEDRLKLMSLQYHR